MLIIVFAVAVAAAAIAVHWQRRYFRSHTGIWAAFVFLFGIPGLFAYWLEHRSVKLDGCQECGHVVPRDRDACASLQHAVLLLHHTWKQRSSRS